MGSTTRQPLDGEIVDVFRLARANAPVHVIYIRGMQSDDGLVGIEEVIAEQRDRAPSACRSHYTWLGDNTRLIAMVGGARNRADVTTDATPTLRAARA